MSESLDMLKSEEGQLNAVFACFGSAAQHAQFFEEALADFLLAYNQACNKSLSVADLEAVDMKLRKKTMGTLLVDFKKYAKISDNNVIKYMDTALVNRNFLMHRFFLERGDYFKTEAGRMGLLKELVGIEQQLRAATSVTNGIRIALRNAMDAKRRGEEARKGGGKTLFTVDIDIPE